MKTITVGSPAPDFELPDQDGKPVSLSELLLDGPVVLFFYPAAMTAGCTKEACHFRDLAGEFAAVGAGRVGISTDPVDRQKEFVSVHDLGFTLLSDADGAVATSYGVRRRFLTPVKRATVVVDTDRTVLGVVTSELNMEVHADRALEVLRSR